MTFRFAERGDSGADALSGAALNVGGPIVSTVVSWRMAGGRAPTTNGALNQALKRLWSNIVAWIDTGRFGVRIKFA
jgi:hypothetical protein